MKLLKGPRKGKHITEDMEVSVTCMYNSSFRRGSNDIVARRSEDSSMRRERALRKNSLSGMT